MIRSLLVLAILASPLAAQDLVASWPYLADSRCLAAPAWRQPPPIDCTKRAVNLVRTRALNALGQGIVVHDPSLTRQQAIDALRRPLHVFFRKSHVFVYEAWDGGANGGTGGTVYNVCAAGVTWTPDRIEVSLADDANNRILRLVLWETANAMLGRAGMTFPDGSGGWGDGPVMQLFADGTGISCESLPNIIEPMAEPLPLAVTQ